MVDDGRCGTPAGAEETDPVVARVRALLDLAARHHLADLAVEAGDFKLRLRAHTPTNGPAARAVAAELTQPSEPATPPPPDDTLLITAPMIGTFYLAPAPGEPPFVAVGDQIEVGQLVAIIEAMKIMNEIQSDQAGQLVELLARNGQGVEYGQALFRLRPGPP